MKSSCYLRFDHRDCNAVHVSREGRIQSWDVHPWSKMCVRKHCTGAKLYGTDADEFFWNLYSGKILPISQITAFLDLRLRLHHDANIKEWDWRISKSSSWARWRIFRAELYHQRKCWSQENHTTGLPAQIFEHKKDELIIVEISRVLKPNGQLFAYSCQ